MSSFTKRIRSSFRLRLLRNIQEHAGGQQHHKQTRAAVADKRQRNSFGRDHAEHDGEINERLAKHHRCNSEREQTAETIRSSERGANAAPAVDCEERYDNHRADEAKFFADDGINKVRVRFGEIKKFLLALHQTDTSESAGANRDERLQKLETRALRIAVGMQKGHEARLAVGGAHDEKEEHGNCGCRAGGDPFPGKACNEKNRGGDENDVDGCTEVRLQKNQSDTNENGANGGKNVVQKIFLAEFEMSGGFALQIKKPRQIQDHGKLGDFRWLNADGAKANPAMRRVGLIEEKCADEHKHNQREGAINDNRL